jgi:hypothetical protein
VTAYLAECYWPGVTAEKLASVVGRAQTAVEELRREGVQVGVTGSWLVPGDEVALLLVDASTAEAARALNERAGVPFERIVEVVSIPPSKPRPSEPTPTTPAATRNR